MTREHHVENSETGIGVALEVASRLSPVTSGVSRYGIGSSDATVGVCVVGIFDREGTSVLTRGGKFVVDRDRIIFAGANIEGLRKGEAGRASAVFAGV